jgi:hypothetical protein
VFRGTLLYILYTWLWGVNLYVFRQNRINHVFIFDFDPNDNLNHIKVFKVIIIRIIYCSTYIHSFYKKTSSVLSIIWVIYFFLYIGAAKERITLIPIDIKYYPLALALTLIFIVVFPFHIFHLSARITLLKVLGNLVVTPFGRADFRECFVADILTSMVIPITDTMYMFCYFFSNTWFNNPTANHNKCHDINRYAGPCLTFLPYAWRLLQCLKKYYETRMKSHLMNGLKYCSAMVVITLNTLHVNLEEEREWAPFRYIWLCFVIFSTLFSFWWDIQMDWGLVSFGKKSATSTRAVFINSDLPIEESAPTISKTEEETTSLLGSHTSQFYNGTNSTDSVLTPLSADSRASVDLVRRRSKVRRLWRKVKPNFRDKRFFSSHTYIIMSAFNFVARFAWAGTISTFFDTYKDYLKILFGSIELVRRCSWSVLRLEWAVVSNSEGYRRHTTVPLPTG